MLKYLNKPCLPENKVYLALVSSEYPEIYDRLYSDFNVNTIKITENISLSDDISTHADCIFTQIDSDNAIVDKGTYNNIVNNLTKGDREFNFFTSANRIKSPYPYEAGLNVRIIGKRMLCNSKYVDKNLLMLAKQSSLTVIHCNQGYTACSTIILNDYALITDDESIHHSAKNNGIDSILISKGSVRLKGHEYGFIGGTCGMIDKNVLAFTGKLESHKDSDMIKAFLNKYNVECVELSDGPLIDVGGIIPVLEVI